VSGPVSLLETCQAWLIVPGHIFYGLVPDTIWPVSVI